MVWGAVRWLGVAGELGHNHALPSGGLGWRGSSQVAWGSGGAWAQPRLTKWWLGGGRGQSGGLGWRGSSQVVWGGLVWGAVRGLGGGRGQSGGLGWRGGSQVAWGSGGAWAQPRLTKWWLRVAGEQSGGLGGLVWGAVRGLGVAGELGHNHALPSGGLEEGEGSQGVWGSGGAVRWFGGVGLGGSQGAWRRERACWMRKSGVEAPAVRPRVW